jgi:hypothetical protein
MKTPTQSWPAATSSAAATLESTPPDMATRTRVRAGEGMLATAARGSLVIR